MADKKNVELQDLSQEELMDKFNNLIEENKIIVFSILAVILIGGFGFYAYNQFYQQPRMETAQEELYLANQYLQKDSFNLALNGKIQEGVAGNFIGYKGIIEQYGSTPAGNLAHYYGGIALLKMGQPKLALDLLMAFSGEEHLQSQAYNLIGDAYSEVQDMSNAAKYYQYAADETDNIPLKVYAMYKSGKLMEFENKIEEALKIYESILEKDQQLAEKMGVDKDIVRLK